MLNEQNSSIFGIVFGEQGRIATSGLHVFLLKSINRAQSLFWLREQIFRRTLEILGAELKILGVHLQILGASTPKEKSESGFVLQYRPILAVLNTMETNNRIRIFHKRVELRYFPLKLLVVCLIFKIFHKDS